MVPWCTLYWRTLTFVSTTFCSRRGMHRSALTELQLLANFFCSCFCFVFLSLFSRVVFSTLYDLYVLFVLISFCFCFTSLCLHWSQSIAQDMQLSQEQLQGPEGETSWETSHGVVTMAYRGMASRILQWFPVNGRSFPNNAPTLRRRCP